MGFFKRAADAAWHFDVGGDVVARLDPANRRVARLAAGGNADAGLVTGIKFTLNDETVRRDYAISILDDEGGVRQRVGVRAQQLETHRLRLGVPVAVKLDGSRGVLDWAVMAELWGLGDAFLAQESLRSAPDDGIRDDALDWSVQRRLGKGTPTDATIVSHQRCHTMGMPTQNWDITLQLANGSTAMVAKDAVPSYAQWYTAPGTPVPAVVDPKNATKAAINWPHHAGAQLAVVRFEDEPPAGSIAEEVEQAGSQASSMASANSPTTDPASGPGSDAAPTLDATMTAWVDMRRQNAMSAKDFDGAVNDWQAAGMCSPAAADLARRMAAS